MIKEETWNAYQFAIREINVNTFLSTFQSYDVINNVIGQLQCWPRTNIIVIMMFVREQHQHKDL